MNQTIKSPSDHVLLQALRARLEMDSGMGIEYVSSPGFEEGIRAASGTRSRSIRAAGEGEGDRPVAVKPVRAEPARPSTPRPSIPRPSLGRPVAPPAPSVKAAEEAVKTFATLVPFHSSPPSPEKEALLEPFKLESVSCQKCGLCSGRQSVVFGEGCLDSKVLFIGEGPGRDEDEQGRPFVGRSGKLLTDIIEKGMKMPRSHVYITNVVKCRPPGNRDPKPEEVAACSVYLEKQIEVITPKVIVAVGGVAGCALLALPPKSSGLRGRWREYNGIPLRVIYHPSYLLRQRNSATDRTRADKETWNDILEVMKLM